ncbi:hypothetical protein DER44DRAFT_442819 [Fusarium oxysporum]|nr:hypothetical protein DER44DRAFT_442819 [Fusarium oxysporum]
MEFYSWFFILFCIRTVISTTSTPLPDAVDPAGMNPVGMGQPKIEKRSGDAPLVGCIYLPIGQPLPLQSFQGLSSQFCLFVEKSGPLKGNTTVERNYLRDGIWHNFSIRSRSTCKRPHSSIDIPKSSCMKDMDTLWHECKNL